ncbi:MAG: hypothetical protein IID39_02180 [Planctomycetes bacterium]|nr:hypothetical protein [Planctomycetota bacterium]
MSWERYFGKGVTWGVLSALIWVPLAAGDPKSGGSSKSEDTAAAKREVQGLWNVDSILDTAVQNLSRRYNLNEEQTAFTDEMMKTRVTRFLDAHQSEIWPLIRDLALYQRKGSMPDATIAKEIGPKALKILSEAKDEIYRSNKEWREILTPDQRKVHDFDLRDMDQKFAAMERNFGEWAEGRPREAGIFPPARKLSKQPPTPKKPRSVKKIKTDGSTAPYDLLFDAYLRNFIVDYELNAGQIEAANSILREVKQRALVIGVGQKKKRLAIERALRLARAEQDTEKTRLLNGARKELQEPLSDLLKELKDRLDQIPDEAQRARAEAKRAERTKSKAARGKPAVSSSPNTSGEATRTTDDD